LGAAVAACEACNEVVDCGATIKWPNDVQIRGKKVAGVRAEVRGGANPELVLGCGINARHRGDDFPSYVVPWATSLLLASPGAGVDREMVCAVFLRRLGEVARQLATGRWEGVAQRWTRLAPGARDQPVTVTQGGRVFEGRTGGIDSGGGLRVRSADGGATVVRLADSVKPVGTLPFRGAAEGQRGT
jgi:BirA family biotin operon repressor/biotin-[acetyl-CoA-carboxylase] ligase